MNVLHTDKIYMEESMSRKIIAALLPMLLVGMTFISCSQKPKEVKVLHLYVKSRVQSFDPAKMADRSTASIYGDIGEALFQYKYTTDTYQLEPLVAETMPSVSENGLVYTINLRKDAYFYDPLKEVFPKGKGRAVNAHDFVYSIKRLADPANKSAGWQLYEGHIKGLDDWAKNGADYSKVIEGFKALNDYTIQVTLTNPYPQILNILALPFSFPVPRELITKYGNKWINYPVGTGAYYLNHNKTIPGSLYVLDKNPSWHGQTFPEADQAGPEVTKKLGVDVLKKYAGKTLPFADRVVWVVFKSNSVQLQNFFNGKIDFSGIPDNNFDSTLVNGKLTREMVDQGITMDINPTLDINYIFFNMDDPILGTNKKLRQAMSMADKHEKALDIFYNGRAEPAQTLIPPGLGGYDPNFRNPYATYNLKKAKQYLAEAGYPEGKGLPTFKYQMYSTNSSNRQMVEFFIDNMKDIGIKVEAVPGDWPTFLKRIGNHEVQLGGIAWGADYPDAQNFLQLNYGPNKAPGPNAANYNNPKFNALYEKGALMQQSPERDKIYAQAAQLAAADCPWIMGVHRIAYTLKQPWLITWVFKDFGSGYSKYLDIDTAMREKETTQ